MAEKDYLNIKLSDDEIKNISTLGLAHIGDAVYGLMVRTWLCAQGKATSKGLHMAAVGYVCANAQAVFAEKIAASLTSEEAAVLRRGRNAKVNSIPQNALRNEYQQATALEALFGYLFLRGNHERLNELFELVMTGG